MDPQLVNILITIATAILVPTATAVGLFLAAYFRKLTQQIDSKIAPAQLELAKSIAAEAVNAAEVAGANQYIASKEDYAVQYATDYLKTKGIVIDLKTVVGLIQSAFLTGIKDEYNTTLPAVKAPTPGASAPGLSDGSIATPPAVG